MSGNPPVTANLSADDVALRIRSYKFSLRLFGACLTEARICSKVATATPGQEALRGFVTAFEGGRNDCGVYIGSEDLPKNPSERLLTLLRWVTNENLIVPLEIKFSVPQWHKREKIVIWAFKFREFQRKTCQAVIIGTQKDPSFVAFIPMHYILESHKSVKELRVESLRLKLDWTLHNLPGFPPEWEPYLVPIERLGEAIAIMRDFVLGRLGCWYNPHTGSKFHDVPRPKAFPITCLQPQFKAWKAALLAALLMAEAFSNHSRNFLVEFPDIVPLLGDLALVSRTQSPLDPSSSSQTIPDEIKRKFFFELKVGHCLLAEDQDGRYPVIHHCQKALGFRTKYIFTWKSAWDYLVTMIRNQKGMALCIPRDEIPDHWWNASTPEYIEKGTMPMLTWDFPQRERLKRYLVDFNKPDEAVRQIERLMGTPPKRACRRIPLAPLPADDNEAEEDSEEDPEEDDDLDEGDDSENERQVPSPLERHSDTLDVRDNHEALDQDAASRHESSIGFGSPNHPSLPRTEYYELWAAEVLNELCRERGEGLIIDLGRWNSMGRFAMVDYTWHPDDKVGCDVKGELPRSARHFHRYTPVLRLGFMTLRWNYAWHPSTIGRGAHLNRFASYEPSVIVCDPYPPCCLRLRHGRWLVPSQHLPRRKTERQLLNLQGENKALLHEYAVDSHDVVDSLLGILRGDAHQGNPAPLSRPKENLEYVCTLEEMKQAGNGLIFKDKEEE